EAYRHAAFPRLLATLSLSADSAAGKRFSARHPLVDLLARLSAQWAIRAASTGLLLLGLQPSATAQSAGWTQWFPAQTPRSKYYVMSAVNPETNRLVAYGGYASPGPTPTTDFWEWTGTNWQPIVATGGPGRWSEGQAAADPLAGVVFFGGWDGGAYLSWTW